MITATFLSGLLATNLATGQVAPDFVVNDIDGGRWSLVERLQRGPVILAFFPKAFTPG